MDAVPALELCAVDGDIGTVDQLHRTGAVLWVRSDTDGHGHPKLGVRDPAREPAGGYCAAQPLGDLDCLGVRRVRQQNGELLSTEACGNVLRSELLLEHAADAAEDSVTGQVTVGVVDLAEEVEVGKEDGDRRLGLLRLAERTFDRELEVPGVEQPCLRIPSRLMLEQRNLEPLLKQQHGRDRERCEPRVRQADGRDGGSQGGEQELRAQAESRSSHVRQPARKLSSAEGRKLVGPDERRACNQAGERPGGFAVEEHCRQCKCGGGGEP